MDKKQLRSIGHGLKPVVLIGNKGLAESVLAEIDRALADHELIKIKIATDDRDERKAMIAQVCDQSGAQLVQSIGKMALILRRAAKPNPRTSNLIRSLAAQG